MEKENYTLPLVQDFYLVAKKTKVLTNRAIPINLVMNDSKIGKMLLEENSYIKLSIIGMTWRRHYLVQGISLLYFQELVLAFLHNQLNIEKNYTIFDEEYNLGVRVQLKMIDEPRLLISRYDENSMEYLEIEHLCKAECRALTRLISYYLVQGELVENLNHETKVQCNYGGNNFTIEMSPQ